MAKQLTNTARQPAEASSSDMQMVFNFLKVSSNNGLGAQALEDRLLTSLAIALHQKAPAH